MAADVISSGRVVKRGGCWPGYWTHDMTTNMGVWYMIPFMVIFFVITLLWEQEEEYKTNKSHANSIWVILKNFQVIYIDKPYYLFNFHCFICNFHKKLSLYSSISRNGILNGF